MMVPMAFHRAETVAETAQAFVARFLGAEGKAWLAATLSAGATTCTFTVSVTGNTAASYANTSTNISGSTAVVDASGVNSTLTVYNRAILSKAYSATTLGVGQSSTLTFTVTNGSGNPTQSGLAFTDTLAGGLSVTAVSALSGTGCSGTPGFTPAPSASVGEPSPPVTQAAPSPPP